MNKRCVSRKSGAKFNRHVWLENFTCERCGKTRNPQAGLKMFRPKRVLDKSSES